MTEQYNIQLQQVAELLQSFEVSILEQMLNLIMIDELPEWNKQSFIGEQIEVDDTFFTASENEHVKQLWQLIVSIRKTLRTIKS